jgi:CRISPR-associated protein Csm3
MRENLDDELTEVKARTRLAASRHKPTAHPRTRAGRPSPRIRFVLDILCEEDKALPSRLVEGLRLLEDDSLGGGGSRGSGRVRFGNLRLSWRGCRFYSEGQPEQELLAGADLAALQALVREDDFSGKLAE